PLARRTPPNRQTSCRGYPTVACEVCGVARRVSPLAVGSDRRVGSFVRRPPVTVHCRLRRCVLGRAMADTGPDGLAARRASCHGPRRPAGGEPWLTPALGARPPTLVVADDDLARQRG